MNATKTIILLMGVAVLQACSGDKSVTEPDIGATGSINGFVWDDEDGNGERDAGEPGLAGVTVYVDIDGNGLFDPGEPSAVTAPDDPATAFEENGQYSLGGIKVGSHVVRAAMRAGFEQTYPDVGTGEIGTDDETFTVSPSQIDIVLGDGETFVTDVSLTVHPVCIRPYHLDVEGPEDLIENMTGVLINGCGGENSVFSIELKGNKKANAFNLVFVDAEFGGELARLPVTVSPAGGGAPYFIEVKSGESIDGIDFGQRRLETGSVHGTAWSDDDGDGERDAGESGLAGLTVYIDSNNDGEINGGESHSVTMKDDVNTTFDETGLYWLENISPGGHVIRQVVPDGYAQTFPANAHFVDVTAGIPVEGIDFGNEP